MAKATTTAPVYVFFGDDDTAKREKLAAARKHFLGDNDPAMALAEYEGDGPGLLPATVLDDVRTVPFLADRRVVVVHKADEFVKRHREALEKYLEDPADRGVLLMSLKSFPANTKLYKLVDAAGGTRKCERPKGRGALSQWLAERARTHGKRLDPAAVDALLDAVGDEPGLLEAEIGKLAVFVGAADRITAADVETLVADNRTAAVFELSDALGEGNPAKALKIVGSLFAHDKGAAYMIVGYLARHLRKLSLGRLALDQGGDDRAVCKAAEYNWTNPGFVSQVRKFRRDRLQLARRRLAEADLTLKSQPDDPRIVVERFLVSVATGR
jgi:DNA polymerase-3 subunit delta